MIVVLVNGFLLILSLFRHGTSVPILSDLFGEETQNKDSRWLRQSRLITHPRQSYRRRFHLFHLTAKHPNAVSYHVIEKPATQRTISAPEKLEDNSLGNGPYHNVYNYGQYQSNPVQSYHHQTNAYQSPEYTIQNPPYGQTKSQDTTYQDILQQVANPMQFSNSPSYYVNHQTSIQNDLKPLEQAAKQFNLASADMNNMELASLIISPVPQMLKDGHRKVCKTHKKRTKSKQQKKKYVKKKYNEMSKMKFQSKPKTANKLVKKLIKNHQDKDKEDDNDREYNESGSGDTWDEEDTSAADDQGYASSKRSKIPHDKSKAADSDEDNSESSTDDQSSTDDKPEGNEAGASDAEESEFGSRYVNKNDVNGSDIYEKKEKLKLDMDSKDTEDGSLNAPAKEDEDTGSGMRESETGSGYINESVVRDKSAKKKQQF